MRLVLNEGNALMALASLISDLNANTNAVAARMDAKLAEIVALQAQGQPPTAAQLADLQAISDHLKALGSDPAAPVPPVPPPPVPAPAPAA